MKVGPKANNLRCPRGIAHSRRKRSRRLPASGFVTKLSPLNPMNTMKIAEQAAVKQTVSEATSPTAINALRAHWQEYLIEAAGLGLFMMSACGFTVLLEHPASVVRQAISSSLLRRLLIGVAMGLTSILLVYSPWGKQSGAHFNPSTTLTFFRLGKIEAWDVAFYVLAQFLGGLSGVMLAAWCLGGAITQEMVHFAATLPGPKGTGLAFVAEVVISFLMMTTVLNVSNSPGIARFTGVMAGALVATYITLESPISGMSMNPARTLASALPARLFNALWIYFTAPPIGMMLAAEVYLRTRGKQKVFCAKLHHDNDKRCIFRCNYAQIASHITN